MQIIPQPSIYDSKNGCFVIDDIPRIICDCTETFIKFCSVFNIFKNAEFNLRDSNIIVEKVDTLEVEYSIKITEQELRIEYRTDKTLFYALATIKQLAYNNTSINCAEIYDKHRYDYRGLQIDTKNDYITVDYIKQLVDVMAVYKLNALHLCLNGHIVTSVHEAKHSALTSTDSDLSVDAVAIGSTDIAHLNSENIATTDDTTKSNELAYNANPNEERLCDADNLKALVQYCKDRYVELVPEVDFAACSGNLLLKYPQFACESKIVKNKAYICIGNDDALVVIKDIIAELAEIFDTRLFHIGFKDVNEKVWENCEICQQKMVQLGLKKTAQLIEYFLGEINADLTAKNKHAVMFGNDIKAKPPKGTILQWAYHDFKKTNCGSWMKRGGRCIISCANYFYLNNSYNRLPLSKVYSFDMMFVGVPINLRKKVLGYECCLWSSKVDTIKDFEKLLFPRVIAFAEKGWTTHSLPYGKFRDRLNTHQEYFNNIGINTAAVAESNPNIFKRGIAYMFGLQNLIRKCNQK